MEDNKSVEIIKEIEEGIVKEFSVISEEDLINDDVVAEIESFDELNLKNDLLRGVYGYGFEKPSPIQRKGILPLIKGRDLIAQAQSGTGKTATYAIGCLQLIDTNVNEVQALILVPARELAQGVAIVC